MLKVVTENMLCVILFLFQYRGEVPTSFGNFLTIYVITQEICGCCGQESRYTMDVC
jgi:hypothetical protein